jgi:O-antigen ligase
MEETRQLGGERPAKAVLDLEPDPAQRMSGSTLAYLGMVLFMISYYFRPEDWTSAARFLPLATLGGGIALLGFVITAAQNGGLRRTREVPLLLFFLFWFMLLVPFSNWPGGSFKVLQDYIWKIAILSIVFLNVIDSPRRLRRMLTIQALGILLIALASRGNIDAETGRLMGVSQAFGNSNDLASLIAVTLPIVVYFIIRSGMLKRLFWIGAALLMIFVAVLTLSRTGFLAMLTAGACLAWHFGIKQRKFGILLAILLLGGGTLIVAAPEGYRDRVASIFNPELDRDGTRRDARGSREAREELFRRSIEITLHNPIMGVGPGQFAEVSGNWHVSHNTFLQFTTETGMPGLFFFLALLGVAFKNLREAERGVVKGNHSEGWVLTGVLRASLITFLVGALFSNFGYNFFTYFLISYTGSLNQIVKIARREGEEPVPAAADPVESRELGHPAPV